MTEHVHEWEYIDKKGEYGVYGIYCSNPDCEEHLYEHQIEARLNATEAMSVEDANIAYDNLAELFKTGEHPVCQSLKSYADTREGK